MTSQIEMSKCLIIMTTKDKNSEETALVTLDLVERKIYFIRDHKVMLDSDLASLYGVETKMLNRAVKRNLSRFPEVLCFN